MPVFSYLAYPAAGKKTALFEALSNIAACRVLPADNREVLILVTDTPDDTAEKQLQQRLKSLSSLQSLSMTFGYGAE